MAYEKLDKNKDGKVTLADLTGVYNAEQHPDVKAGKKTQEEVLKEFMAHWDTQVADGIVSIEEFTDYYRVPPSPHLSGCLSLD
jgi:Ca2+-binding EF-hand superfamily protein